MFLSLSILAMSPLIIVCPSALSLAISQTPLFFLNLLKNYLISSKLEPRIAIMAPLPTGTASCIDFPLS